MPFNIYFHYTVTDKSFADSLFLFFLGERDNNTLFIDMGGDNKEDKDIDTINNINKSDLLAIFISPNFFQELFISEYKNLYSYLKKEKKIIGIYCDYYPYDKIDLFDGLEIFPADHEPINRENGNRNRVYLEIQKGISKHYNQALSLMKKEQEIHETRESFRDEINMVIGLEELENISLRLKGNQYFEYLQELDAEVEEKIKAIWKQTIKDSYDAPNYKTILQELLNENRQLPSILSEVIEEDIANAYNTLNIRRLKIIVNRLSNIEGIPFEVGDRLHTSIAIYIYDLEIERAKERGEIDVLEEKIVDMERGRITFINLIKKANNYIKELSKKNSQYEQ